MTTTSATPPLPLRVTGAMRSHVGRVRRSNEDCVAFVQPRPGAPEERIGFLALVADGMGGHAAGEVASAIAADVVRRSLYAGAAAPPENLRKAFFAANAAILNHADAYPETRGMGTTCTALIVRQGALWLAHVGDSRAYLLRDGALHQLSRDQTLHAQLIRDGALTEEEAANSPGGNYLLQALGARAEFTPEIWAEAMPLLSGDRLLLCSDGLYGHVDDAEIARLLIEHEAQTDGACDALIEAALQGGGSDNISVGVFAVALDAPDKKRDQASTREIKIFDDAS
jgi:PPM family protein phosphatase